MKYLDLTFADAASNLACDEALLDLCEAGCAGEILRLWEPAQYFVVVGYSNTISSEVNVAGCEARGIPILRRFSGGGAVVQGPGCLNYALVVKNERLRDVGNLMGSYARVMKPHRRIFRKLLSESVEIKGISDLALAGRKFSGNAQHRKRLYTVFHGTFLVNFDLSLVESCLRIPSRQPAYRQSRSHKSFLRNLSIDSGWVRQALRKAWRAAEEFRDIPYKQIEGLIRKRYANSDWNHKF